MTSPKRLFPTAIPQNINYTFTDVAAATGYTTYYAGTASGANILSSQVFNSNNLNTNALITSSEALVKYIDKDFDVLFNTPQNIRGDAIVEVPVGIYHIGNSSKPVASMAIIAKIRRWDGTTETEVASASSPVWTAGVSTATAWNYNIRTAKIKIPSTHYKRGEYLRLTIEGWAVEQEPNNNQIVIYHDPANRSFNDGETYNNMLASGSSILKLQLPLKIEI